MSDALMFDDSVWGDRVRFSDLGGGFAYVPDRAVVRDADSDAALALAVDGEQFGVIDSPFEGFNLIGSATDGGTFDALRVVAHLRADGIDAQPDHVLFAHSDQCCCMPHPAALLDPGSWADPFWANPFRANPFRANPFRANPFRANPFRANAAGPEGPSTSSAVASARPDWAAAMVGSSAIGPRIVVLDTGLAVGADLPAMLQNAGSVSVGRRPGDVDVPDANRDRWLDPVAGHGTFIAGIIERIAPGCQIEIRRVIGPQGDGRESAVVAAIGALAAESSPPDILSLSFGGYVWERAPMLSAAIHRAQRRGTVVVASAGNDGTCRPTYPAAIPGVVSVGAIGPAGPAGFTNYGDWVRACAPGVDIVSSFFANFNGPRAPTPGGDIDHFLGWARWSGTSFSAPTVVGALAREMRRTGGSATMAVATLIDGPALGRIPGLGTVVNV